MKIKRVIALATLLATGLTGGGYAARRSEARAKSPF